jgi:uncharacterized membrane protein YoaK (UPF0700 family)
VLTAVAACADAVGYLRFHVFPANMTGNTVLLAVGLGAGPSAHLQRSATALGTFVLAAVTAGVLRSLCSSTRLFLSVALSVEGAVLATAASLFLSGATAGGGAVAVVALLSAAMGLQSASVTELGLGVSTTYLTGTWTAVSSFAGRRARSRTSDDGGDRFRRQVAVLACYFAAAAAAGAVTRLA